jgi:hypothetical protein
MQRTKKKSRKVKVESRNSRRSSHSRALATCFTLTHVADLPFLLGLMHRSVFCALVLCSVFAARAGSYTDDLFARALENESTAPDYVLISVIDPDTHTKRIVCTTANLFLGAIHREHGLGYTEADRKRAKEIALNQRGRIFVFRNKTALANLSDYATPEALSEVQKIFATKSDSELLDGKLVESLTVCRPDLPYKEAVARHNAYRDAVARSLLERGIGCKMGDFVDALYPYQSTGPRDPEAETRMRERAAASQHALAAARGLAGYDELQRSFRVEDALLGYVNLMPESLFIKLRATKGQSIDAAWWWNPLSGGAPSLSWYDFLAAYGEAARIVGKHPWLSELTHDEGKRSLELHLLGRSIAAANLATFILPPWQHAGMAGQPAYCFLARRGDHSWVELLFSDGDDRAFVRNATPSDPAPQSPLDSLYLGWHPRGKRGDRHSQYALIAPDGSVTLQTYVMSEQ